MSAPLKPCPFCGAGVDLHLSRIPRQTAFRIRCASCGSQMEWSGSDLDEVRIRAGIVAAWNRRAPSQGPAPEGWRDIASLIERDICELPGDDDPEHDESLVPSLSALRGILEDRLAPLPQPPAADGWRPTHRHRKGGLYRVITRAQLEADLAPAVVYEGQDGRVWVRPAAEFDDGRFVPIPQPPTSGGA